MSNHYQFAQGVELLHKVESHADQIEVYAAHRGVAINMREIIGHAQAQLAAANQLAKAAADLADWLKSVEEPQ